MIPFAKNHKAATPEELGGEHVQRQGEPRLVTLYSTQIVDRFFSTAVSRQMRVSISLRPEDIELLKRPIRGSGGWQILLRRIQDRIKGDELTLEVKDVGKILRYVSDYGSGGFEGRLGVIVQPLFELAEAVLEALGMEKQIVGQRAGMRPGRGRRRHAKSRAS